MTGATGEFTDAVLAWGEPRLRDLPWRHTRDPWLVLVSEVMLQQTQVSRVISKYLAFTARFPTPQSCAAASLGDVLRLWQGLGYPRRARNLHLAATQIAADGQLPTTLTGLLRLPGVGPYTARAVLAFAFEADVAVVDTNIARVYSRVGGARLTASEVQARADGAVPIGESWLWNQSIMELGALLCRPASPRCGECPVATICMWRGASTTDPAVGSAGVSGRQARFDGSDRQARGLLLAALQHGPVSRDGLAEVMQRPDPVAERLLATLVTDDLVVIDGALVRLPD